MDVSNKEPGSNITGQRVPYRVSGVILNIPDKTAVSI
jgi:hypothetical protein